MIKDAVTSTFENIAARIPLTSPEVNEFESIIRNFIKSPSQTMLIPVSLAAININENIRETDEDESEFQSLKSSIKTAGIIQPPLLTIRENSVNFELVCVAGHRRILAAKALGQDKVTCLIRKFQDNHYQLISTVIENTHRKNLHPFELAEGIRRLVDGGYSFEELENLFDKNQWNLRRFNKMNEWTTLSRSLVKEHADRFTPTWLLHLAARALTPQEVEQEIKIKLGLSEVQSSIKLKGSYQERAKTFFEKRTLSNDQKELIEEFMKEIGIMKNPKNNSAAI